eukprot:CAMPEP_0119051006 /NCGR_PEP_ID=MMETSP1177-20130426/72760_1 /TAXON_ID=2985 /ORGANISM="Ochromonas sp, Strain CCMP1899" /LENGTH=474 /DNA_ID=CAMNT_0007030053 /DNA_START=344 /DNA_END=1768 /DNA_ORIENTATION=+
MDGCYKAYSKGECDATERARMAMNLAQPQHQHNYTEMGFKKTRVPMEVWADIQAFYEENKHKEAKEDWPRGNTYVNSWDSPSQMISFEDTRLRGGLSLKQRIWAAVKPVLSEWTGHELSETSLYGIRVYRPGSILATHVDRLPLVSSCIIQVAQDTDEPWPVEVIAHDGVAHNITMTPGDMVLYESHSVLHGRPYPLVGRSYANIFVHFIPVDHEELNNNDEAAAAESAAEKLKNTPSRVKKLTDHITGLFKSSKKEKISGHEGANHDEAEVRRHREDIEAEEEDRREKEEKEAEIFEENEKEDREAVERFRGGEDRTEEEIFEENAERDREEVESFEKENKENEKEDNLSPDGVDGKTALHLAASEGDLKAVQDIFTSHLSGSIGGENNDNYDILHARDINGWQAHHEAVRGGYLDVLRYLVDQGADLDAQTQEGGTALWWAKRIHEEGHPIITYLEEIGAPDESTETHADEI